MSSLDRSNSPWWRDAVVYQVYVRSFADGDGDGVGDLPGITARLPHLADLGVDAVWLTPFYRSPQHDHGYDVADYRDVDPLFGDLADAETLVASAHDLGLRVIVDLVPNHTSSEHAWFRAAVAAGPGSPERSRYHFRPWSPEPPNNWRSVFGGSAWTRVDDGSEQPEWYLHLFDSSQPDLDWEHPEVGDMFVDVLRFWLDRGVDGFRVDVAHGLVKAPGLPDHEAPDQPPPGPDALMVARERADEPMWDQPGVHEVYRRWHDVLASCSAGPDGDRMMVAEAWTPDAESMSRYVRPDEFQQAFNFAWLLAPWSASAFADVVDDTLAAVGRVDASPTWVLSNHDVVRHATRYAAGTTPERGLARARAATLAMLALPGSAYLYQGEELGLPEVDVAPEDRTDPSWHRTGEVGRDGCRVPIPWSGERAPYGFGPAAEGTQPWLPQPEAWAGLSVEAQQGDEDSTLAFYRRALSARRSVLADAPDEVAVDVDGHVVTLLRGDLVCQVNCGERAVAPPVGEVVVCSGPTPGAVDTTTWVRTCRSRIRDGKPFQTDRSVSHDGPMLDLSPRPGDLEAVETASVDALRALQTERLRWSVAHAYENVPHYRAAYDAAGVHPDDVRELSDLARLPFTTKADLRASYPFGMFAVPREQVARIHASSGTTGKPTVVGYTADDLDVWADVVARSIRAAGGRRGDLLHNAYGYGLFTGGLGAHAGAERLGCTVVPVSGGMTERQVQLITDFAPDIITVTPSYMLAVIEEMERQGIDPRSTSLKVGIFGAEPWTDDMRREIEQRLDMHAVDIYGLSEVMGPGVASECVETKDGPTIWEDHFYPEVIDPVTGEVLGDGEEGELVLTSLTKQAMPIIRYRTRDLTRLLPGTARTMRRMEKITGRTDDMIILRGVNLFPTQIEELILGSTPALSPHFQCRLEREGTLDSLTVVVEHRPDASAEETAAAATELRRLVKASIGVSVTVDAVAPGTVERSLGKMRRIVDARPAR